MPAKPRFDSETAPTTPSELQLPPPVLVDTPAAFGAMLRQLAGAPIVALDTESNSLYRYFYKVCLIQISAPALDYLVDPLRLADLSGLGAVLADPAVQKVFHAAENDILMLKRDFGFGFANIFDTMLAARILGWPQVGLASVLHARFGLTLDKRAQLTDWSQRPLSAGQLSYARLDSHYLLPLRDLLIDELRARKRWREANEAFAALPGITFVEKPFDPEGFWRIKGARDLTPAELAVLRELYLWRDEQARALDRPPFKVMGDDSLLAIAVKQPAKTGDLPLSARQVELYGRGLVSAVLRGKAAPPPQPPARTNHNGARPDPQVLARFDRLRAWRAARAEGRQVDADIILTNETLMNIARAGPATLGDLESLGVMGAWKLEEYGPDVLRVLNAG